MSERTNEDWLSALADPPNANAIEDLRAILLRGLAAGLRSQGTIADADLEDFAQDGLLRILDNLETFRGESRFTTWAQKIAIRVAFTELRRRRWRDQSLDELVDGPNEDAANSADYTPALMADTRATPEQEAIRQNMLATVRSAIAEKLTDRQREAIIAVRVQGRPVEDVAQQLQTSPNTLYKLLFDARKRLKSELLTQGVSAEEILDAFES